MKAGERYGPWVVREQLGEGGVGEVWLCERDGGQLGALKVLRGEPPREERARFMREVRALERLRHEGIVRLIDTGFEDAWPWLVMEYVEGENLEQRLKRGEALELGTCLAVFARLADGLAHAHAQGIHHRDVKASNVVLRPDGQAVLVDFGTSIETDATGVTAAGLVMGTFAYMPPEVLTGGTRDPELGDIYALGQLLHEALTGELLFRGSEDGSAMSRWNMVVAEKLDADALDPGDAFPSGVRDLVGHASQIEPEDRLPTMAEFAERLNALAADPGAHAPARPAAPPPAAPKPPPAPSKEPPLLLVALLPLVAGLATSLLVHLLRG